jgi:HEAT repeat protein
VTLTLLEQPSASERLQGVSWSYRVPSQDEKVLSALLQALKSDPNVNVRVAVVDALRPFAGEAMVKNGLLQSLAKETDPLVQIELINLMVNLGEKASIPVLEKMMRNPDYNLAVHQRPNGVCSS